MKKILITGASGLLGKAVLRQLKEYKEYQVYAVTTNKRNIGTHACTHVIACDLTVEEQRKKLLENIKPDILLHLAWDQSNASFRMSQTNLLWLNISTSLLYLFEQYGGRRFLFAGSSSEYDGTEGVFDENVDVLPASLYGLCKKTFNEFARDYCKLRGIEYVGMRLFTIYGEEDTHSFGAIPSAIRILGENEELLCNSPDTTRDYIYAGDAAMIIRSLLEHPFTGIVNVASGKARTMREVFQYIGTAMGKSQYVVMNENSTANKQFEADISLLKKLGISGYNSDFEIKIREILRRSCI